MVIAPTTRGARPSSPAASTVGRGREGMNPDVRITVRLSMLETTAICVIDEHGRQVKTTGAASDPQAIATALRRHAKKVVRIVLESGQLSTWLTRELRALDLPVVCVDARQAHRALSGRLNKSDPADAEGLAQLARTGWFREVHIKSLTSDRLRALLSA